MRLAVVLLAISALALTIGEACGVPWREVLVALLVTTALLLAPDPRRPAS